MTSLGNMIFGVIMTSIIMLFVVAIINAVDPTNGIIYVYVAGIIFIFGFLPTIVIYALRKNNLCGAKTYK